MIFRVEALHHFLHPDQAQGELFPFRPAFAQDVLATAAALRERDGPDAPLVAELREDDELNGSADRLFWAEVRRACRAELSGGIPMAPVQYHLLGRLVENERVRVAMNRRSYGLPAFGPPR